VEKRKSVYLTRIVHGNDEDYRTGIQPILFHWLAYNQEQLETQRVNNLEIPIMMEKISGMEKIDQSLELKI
jgi:hypothetical protein